jgi:hypothetical protein
MAEDYRPGRFLIVRQHQALSLNVAPKQLFIVGPGMVDYNLDQVLVRQRNGEMGK